MQVASAAFQIKDRVGHELAGTVPGGLSAPVDFEDRVRESLGTAKAGLITGPADGVNGFVFEQEQLFARCAGEIVVDEAVL